MASVVTLTPNPALDKSVQIERVVADQKLYCQPPQWQPGGGGINAGRVIGRLGGDPLLIYPCGGPQGEMLRDLLDETGIRQTPIPISGLTGESFAVRETETNQQYRFSVPGPTLDTAEWEACLDAVRQLDPAPDYLVLSGGLSPGMPDDFYGQAISWAGQNGVRVILDTHDAPLPAALAAGVYLWKPNLRELRQYVERPLEDETAQQEALQQIIDQGGARYIVLSLGAAGALFVSADSQQRLRAPTVQIRSKVGAGDSMVGGIVWALTEGYRPLAAAQLGVAAGAAAVKSPGSELCHRDEVMALYQQIANV